MKYTHVQRKFKSPFFVNCKKHYCTDCGKRLKKITVTKIVNSQTPDAKDFDFHTVDNYMIGNVKFIWTEMQCPKCKRQYTIDEVRQIEKKTKNTKYRWLIFVLLLFFVMNCIIGISNTEKNVMKNSLPVKYLYNASPFYVYFRKHVCPRCGEKLGVSYESVIVNSNSPEAKNYDFTTAGGDSKLSGDVEFRKGYLKCPECKFSISFDEMKKLENQSD